MEDSREVLIFFPSNSAAGIRSPMLTYEVNNNIKTNINEINANVINSKVYVRM